MVLPLVDEHKPKCYLCHEGFENIEELNKWLDTEAYITGNVWENIDIIPCKLAPAFEHLAKKSKH